MADDLPRGQSDDGVSYVRQVEVDNERFQRKVEDLIRKNYTKYLTDEKIVGKGEGSVKVPLRGIVIPRFRYDFDKSGGTGEGDGEVGDQIGQDRQPGDQPGEPGDQPGEITLEAEVSLDKLVQILGEELELPNIKPKTNNSVLTERGRYVDVSRQGPKGQLLLKRTFKNFLRRVISSGEYDPCDSPDDRALAPPELPDVLSSIELTPGGLPPFCPIPDDMRYRHPKKKPIPYTSAVVFLMMDISGSMGDEQKQLVRLTSFWIEQWLKRQYQKVSREHIVFHTDAYIVDPDTFYRAKESGGTRVSAPFERINDLVMGENAKYDPANWNIYPFLFSDGDNTISDNSEVVKRLRAQMPWFNQFSYCQVKSVYGTGELYRTLDQAFGNGKEDKYVSHVIASKEDLRGALRAFLGKGK